MASIYESFSTQNVSTKGPLTLKAKKTHGFNSCIVISVYPLDKSYIKKVREYRNN